MIVQFYPTIVLQSLNKCQTIRFLMFPISAVIAITLSGEVTSSALLCQNWIVNSHVSHEADIDCNSSIVPFTEEAVIRFR